MRNVQVASRLFYAGRRWVIRQPVNCDQWHQSVPTRRHFHSNFAGSSFMPSTVDPEKRLKESKVGDNVLLKAQGRDDRSFWIGALRQDGMFESHQGNIPHEQIIGKASRDRVTSSAGKIFSMHWPTLAEHCVMTPRVVTPIYPPECNTIVSLLDIHVAAPPTSEQEDSSLEILEAGTGHGALTLHLARAIHAANAGISPRMYLRDNEALVAERSGELAKEASPRGHWKKQRRAVVHSLDINKKHLKAAKRTVRSFGRGLYANNVDFHCTNVPSFIRDEYQRRQSTESFLSKVILDMPDAHTQLQDVAAAMRANATVIIFCPQITQILDAVKITKRLKLPLVLDQVVELGVGISGGRQWDVRVTPRPPPTASEALTHRPKALTILERVRQLFGSPKPSAQDKDDPDAWYEVCKPKLGEKTVNGGFIGLWIKTQPLHT